MRSGKIRILIADDHAVLRDGIRRILEQEQDLEVIAETDNGEDAVKLAVEFKPDVAMIDIEMPKLDGIEATRQIKALCPDIAILVLTAYDDDQFIFSLLEAGAAGYLLKNVRGRDLTDAIRAVYQGESVLHPAIAHKVLNRFVTTRNKPSEQESVEVLSKREMEVLQLASKGLSNHNIARELFLSENTVHAHLQHIFQKLHVSSRTEAVIRALKERWVTLDDVS